MNHDISKESKMSESSELFKKEMPEKENENKWKEISEREESQKDFSESFHAKEDENTEQITENDSMAEEAVSPSSEEDEMVRLRQALEEKEIEMKYLQASLQNKERLFIKDLEKTRKDVREKTIEAFLPLADSYEESIKQSSTLEQFQEGTQHIITLMRQIFEKLGIKAIEPKAGEAFDPNFHTAISTEAGEVNDTILKVFQKGYQLHERIVRPAMVVVSKVENKE